MLVKASVCAKAGRCHATWGTSRGIVTKYMSQFRKQGYVSYSRRGIHLYCDSLKTFLDKSTARNGG